MEEIDLSKEKKVEILKETVSKFLPNKTFIYDDPNFLIVDSDKRFGFSKTGFIITFNDVRVVPNAPEKSLINCDSSS